MKTFDLPAGTRLKLTKTTPRKEHHGDELKQAISLRLTWETTNENLAALHPGLKDALYWRPPALEAQQTAEGIPETTPTPERATLGRGVETVTIRTEHLVDEIRPCDSGALMTLRHADGAGQLRACFDSYGSLWGGFGGLDVLVDAPIKRPAKPAQKELFA